MPRAAMLRPADLAQEPEPIFSVRLTRARDAFIVSVVGGPQDLLARTSEHAAREAGAVYMRANYRWSSERGWVPR